MSLLTLLNHIQTGSLETFSDALALYLETPNANLNQGPYVKLPKGQGNYLSPLMLAAKMGQIEMVRLLLEKGVDLNYQTLSQSGKIACTALIAGVQSGSFEMVSFLLKKGAQVDCEGIYYSTALIEAVKLSRLDIVTLLLEYGANINAYAYLMSPFSQSITLWNTPPTEKQIALTKYLIEKGTHCTKLDFIKIFYTRENDTYLPSYSSNDYYQKRLSLYQLFEKQARLLPLFNVNNERTILIEIITHNNKIRTLAKIYGNELACHTLLPSIATLIGSYLFTNKGCYRALTYEFDRIRTKPSLSTHSKNKTTPSPCSIL